MPVGSTDWHFFDRGISALRELRSQLFNGFIERRLPLFDHLIAVLE
jgi:hypothetical protein